jgi:hypothetical protein
LEQSQVNDGSQVGASWFPAKLAKVAFIPTLNCDSEALFESSSVGGFIEAQPSTAKKSVWDGA